VPKRLVFHSVKTKHGWVVKKGTVTVGTYDTQLQAEKSAKDRGRAAYAAGGLGQAVLHKSTGVIRTEHTYGKDPEKTKG
jgi:hypothetical protein